MLRHKSGCWSADYEETCQLEWWVVGSKSQEHLKPGSPSLVGRPYRIWLPKTSAGNRTVL